MWTLEWGEHLKDLEFIAAKGKVMPQALLNRPWPFPEVEWLWVAFNELHSARPANGFAATPLPNAEIVAWMSIHNIEDANDKLDVYQTVRYLDSHWLTWARNKTKRGKEKPNGDSSASD